LIDRYVPSYESAMGNVSCVRRVKEV